ncbi:hypothetical protein Mapa_015432 [Marchantia paleacea]|nr:hypothetical protein Mapa_015432 [Marchantia paleacea]
MPATTMRWFYCTTSGSLPYFESPVDDVENELDSDNWDESQSSELKLDSDANDVEETISCAMAPPVILEENVSLLPVDPSQRFEYRCPPGGERRVVLYLTSLRGIRKTYDDCRQLKLLLKAFGVAIDERDVSMHSGFRQELVSLLGEQLSVPRLFIKGHYVGGAEEVARLHDEGRLASLLPEFRLARQMSWNPEHCQGCGGMRFVPCLECSGSRKVRDEEDQIAQCPDCNENGLMKCPVCFS